MLLTMQLTLYSTMHSVLTKVTSSSFVKHRLFFRCQNAINEHWFSYQCNYYSKALVELTKLNLYKVIGDQHTLVTFSTYHVTMLDINYMGVYY